MESLVLYWRTLYPMGRSTSGPHVGPVYKATLELPFMPEDQSVFKLEESWSTSTELFEKDGFSHEDVAGDAVFNSGLSASEFRQRMTDGIEQGKAFDDVNVAPSGSNPEAEEFYDMLAKGITGWESEHQVVTRTRIAPTSYPWNRVIFSTRYIYETSQLNLPESIGYSFDVPSTAPTNMKWGWRLRSQNFRTFDGRQEETITWSLAAWSTFYYKEEPTGSSFP